MAIFDQLNSVTRRISAWPLYILLTIPGAWLFFQALNNQLGADPLKALEHQLGVYALQLLIASLLVTPIRNRVGLNLIKFRRAIGLMAFFYTASHLLTYLWLDQQWWWDAIIKDLTKRPYIIIGFTAFLAMVPLAITSNNASIKRLGAGGWKKLHRLAYLAALGGAVHYVLLEKTWQREPIIYVLIVVALLAYRYIKANKGMLPSRQNANG